jgi:hypothetical protein
MRTEDRKNHRNNQELRTYNFVKIGGVICSNGRKVYNNYGTFLCSVGDNVRIKVNVYNPEFISKYGFNSGDYFKGECNIMIRKVKSSNNYVVEFRLLDIKEYQKSSGINDNKQEERNDDRERFKRQ